ncbi:hypothetical protein VNO78_16991 [Psophocarpus tetragonolobus]|uniref:Uncharacterized protein n=1 Tax=Psophocarpus tetragonolobus TaxID=3891 RepID=A0AAN9XKG9_PSOTE
MVAFNASVVGVDSIRKKYQGLLLKFFKKAFEDYRRNDSWRQMCNSNAIQFMEKRLGASCNASDAKIDNVAKIIVVVLMIRGRQKLEALLAVVNNNDTSHIAHVRSCPHVHFDAQPRSLEIRLQHLACVPSIKEVIVKGINVNVTVTCVSCSYNLQNK